jgi:glycosyltransferase involved in cell wall biosynthesis
MMPLKTLVIIPAYNEELNIGSVIDDIKAHCPHFDVVVVNDGSTDRTTEIALHKGVMVLTLPFNLGIGGAMQTGFRYALQEGYKFALQFDGDGQHRADQIEVLLKPVREGKAHVVIGSRFLGEEKYRSGFVRLLGIRVLSQVISFLVGQRIICSYSAGIIRMTILSQRLWCFPAGPALPFRKSR